MTLLMRDQENIEKGIEQGIQQREQEMILGMLQNHIPMETIAKIAGMDVAQVQEMKEIL